MSSPVEEKTPPARPWWDMDPRLVTVLVGLGMVALALAAPPGRILFDDSFITYRYAENLASGNGLVFNPGERVEGYSNLTWTLFLAGAALVGVPPILASQLGGAAAAILLAWGVCELLALAGASRWAAPGVVLAIGLSAPVQFWTLAGLETAAFATLLLWLVVLAARGIQQDRVGPAALLVGGIMAMTRPEGPLFLAGVVAGMAVSSPRLALRLLGGSSFWILQLLFRRLYYGDWLPNTYYAKVWEGADRWRSGWDYVRGFLADGGVPYGVALAAGLVGAIILVRHPSGRLLLPVIALGLFFALSSGGEGFPHGRFLYPIVPVLLTAAGAAAPGRAALIGSVLLPILVVTSTAIEPARYRANIWERAFFGGPEAREQLAERLEILTRPEDTPQIRVGNWLRSSLPEGSLIAVADCGQIPWASGLPTLDLVGLMDRHIARLPGRKHGKVDLHYVVNRSPEAVVLHLTRLGNGLPIDTRLASFGPFLAAYRLVHLEPDGPEARYFVFRRRPDVAPAPLPQILDLTSRLVIADTLVETTEGVEPTRWNVREGFRYISLPQVDIDRLEEPLPEEDDEIGAEVIAELDQSLQALGPETYHGIVVQLSPEMGAGSATFEIPDSLPEGSRLKLEAGFAPWLWRKTTDAATVKVEIRGASGSVNAITTTLDPHRNHDHRAFLPLDLAIETDRPPFTVLFHVTRSGPSGSRGEPFEVLLASPRIEMPLPGAPEAPVGPPSAPATPEEAPSAGDPPPSAGDPEDVQP